MSNIEAAPKEMICEQGPHGEGAAARTPEILEPRDVPLDGIRAMNVRRTLPQRGRSLIGAWCFLDHYGPDDVSETGGMRVARHPHTGLQTLSWLFSGGIDHLDSAGFAATVRPGEMNLMTAGRGITHSEFSTADTTVLHGAQLWIALPDHARHMPPTFESHRPEPVTRDGAAVSVFIGSLLGSISPVTAHTPIVGAEMTLWPGATLRLTNDEGLASSFEYGVLLDRGSVSVNGTSIGQDQLAYLAPGQEEVTIEAGESGARVLLIGGEPFGEKIVMWWNFVGREHDEIVAYRSQYQHEIGREDATEQGSPHWIAGERFGPFPDGQPAPLPAPVMPISRLKPRT